jgi:hypothetical protein
MLPPTEALLLTVAVEAVTEVKVPASGFKFPIVTLLILPVEAGLKFNVPEIPNDENVPALGVVAPITTLSRLPGDELELIDMVPVSVVVPFTVSPVSVPRLVRLLLTTVGPSVVVEINSVFPVLIEPLLRLSVPEVNVKLPFASTVKPGLTNPVADLIGSMVNALTRLAIFNFLVFSIYVSLYFYFVSCYS